LNCQSAILDGEVIVQDRRGASDFGSLQAALRARRAPLIFYAFDLLHLDGKDLRERPLIERRAKLRALIGSDASPLQFGEEFVGDGAAFFRTCAEHRLEGTVSKLANSPYRSGRSKTWLKTKCFTLSDLTLAPVARSWPRPCGESWSTLVPPLLRSATRPVKARGEARRARPGSSRADLVEE
jgi:bifunctional non-homologous end joining protein LigD